MYTSRSCILGLFLDLPPRAMAPSLYPLRTIYNKTFNKPFKVFLIPVLLIWLAKLDKVNGAW